MTFNPQHVGLYFTHEHVQVARSERDKDPFRAAYLYLTDREQTGAQAAQWYGLRYRFDGDERAAEQSHEELLKQIETPIAEDETYLTSVAKTVMLTQTFEMVRDHPTFDANAQVRFLNILQERVNMLSTSPYKDTQVENLWMALLVMSAGIALDREEVFTVGAEVFQRTIRDDVRPRGFMTKAVEGRDGGSLYRQILSASALVLMAEAASHAGVDLWNYTVRGVSVTTAAIYPIYYFYTPEKWEWDEGITVDESQMLFRHYGGYLEMVYRQTRFKDLKPLLEDLRPIYDPQGGGLTTLTHGVALKRGLFG